VGAHHLQALIAAVVDAGVEVAAHATGRGLEESGLGELHPLVAGAPLERDVGGELVGAEALGDLVGAHGHHAVAEAWVVAQFVRIELLLGRGDHRRRILGGEDALLGGAVGRVGTGGEAEEDGGAEPGR
jgi:hypothetical protein